MDKKTFINELKTALSVLQEDELNDIINEYEQHIDMKMKNGLSEDEAIADFGSLNELTADILEAYHVRADYADGKKKGKKPFSGNDSGPGKEILQQTGKTCKAAGEKAAHGLRGLGAWLLGVIVFWKQAAAGVWKRTAAWWQEHRRKRLEAPSEPPETAEEFLNSEADSELSVSDNNLKKGSATASEGRLRQRSRGTWNRLCRGILGLFHWGIHLVNSCFRLCARIAVWCLRLAWNACWIGFALFCAVLGLFSLFGFGLLAVLWLQRYPLAGVTVGCLGLVCCFFSAAGFSLTLLWRRKKQDKKMPLAVQEIGGELHA